MDGRGYITVPSGSFEFLSGKAAYFDGLSYRIEDDGSLNAFVIARDRDGVEREFAFRFTRR